MSEPPPVSVVIPVHNGRETIGPCLAALMASDGGPPEVLVVDDGSTDDTTSIIDRYPVRLLYLNSRGGPAHARNRGAELATGTILLFIDADVVVRPDTVRRVVEQFEQDPTVAALLGSYDDNPAARSFFSQYRNLLHHAVHQQGRENADTFWSGCGAVRRDVFLTMGGFSEAFHRPAIEDIELGARMVCAGHRIRLVKDLQVQHLKRWSLMEIIRTDIRDRAIPWSMLILSGYRRGGGLNLQLRYRLSAAVAGLALLAVAGSLVWHSGLMVAVIVLFVWFVYLNRGILRIFHRCRGTVFTLSAIPMLLLYYFYSSAAFGVGVLMHIAGRRLA